MRCWPSSERTTNPSSRRKRQDSLSLSLVLFPPKPLRWVSAGALLGAVIKTPVLYFLHFCVGGYHLPSGCCGCVGTTPRGVYFSRKNGFLRVGALRRRTSCSLLHTALFRRSCMGVVSLPSACASCCRNAGRPRVTVAYLPFLCRHSARPVWAEYPRRVHTPPQPRTAHTAAHTPKHGAFRTGGGITTLGAFCAVRKPCAAGCQNGILCRFLALVGCAHEECGEPSEQRCAHARRCSEASRPRRVALLHCCFLRCTSKLRGSLSLRRRAERKIC